MIILEAPPIIPIAQLDRELDIPENACISGIITVVWPFSSAENGMSILLVEHDTRLRQNKGQVKIRFDGLCGRHVSKSALDSTETLQIKLKDATWVRDETQSQGDPRRIDCILHFTSKLDAKCTSTAGVERHIQFNTALEKAKDTNVSSPHRGSRDSLVISHSSARPILNHLAWQSPAILRRSHHASNIGLSSEADDEDEYYLEPSKRIRFGRHSSQWRFASRSPSPAVERRRQQISQNDVEDQKDPIGHLAVSPDSEAIAAPNPLPETGEGSLATSRFSESIARGIPSHTRQAEENETSSPAIPTLQDHTQRDDISNRASDSQAAEEISPRAPFDAASAIAFSQFPPSFLPESPMRSTLQESVGEFNDGSITGSQPVTIPSQGSKADEQATLGSALLPTHVIHSQESQHVTSSSVGLMTFTQSQIVPSSPPNIITQALQNHDATKTGSVVDEIRRRDVVQSSVEVSSRQIGHYHASSSDQVENKDGPKETRQPDRDAEGLGSKPTDTVDDKDASVGETLESAPGKAVETPANRGIRGLRTKYGYFAPLASLSSHFGKLVDILAIVCDCDKISQAGAGPRDYFLTMSLTDPSMPSDDRSETSTHSSISAQVFRPYRESLPKPRVGDIIMLRDFHVHNFSGHLALISQVTSAWAVFRNHDDPEIAGPPIEYGCEEKDAIEHLRKWWNKDLEAEERVTPIISKRVDPKPATAEFYDEDGPNQLAEDQKPLSPFETSIALEKTLSSREQRNSKDISTLTPRSSTPGQAESPILMPREIRHSTRSTNSPRPESISSSSPFFVSPSKRALGRVVIKGIGVDLPGSSRPRRARKV